MVTRGWIESRRDLTDKVRSDPYVGGTEGTQTRLELEPKGDAEIYRSGKSWRVEFQGRTTRIDMRGYRGPRLEWLPTLRGIGMMERFGPPIP